MKTTSLSTKLIMVAILLAVLAYFGVQGYNYLVDSQTTTAVYAYHAEKTIAMNGYFVRDEEVVGCTETLIELTRTEGERVAANKPLATVYQSAETLERQKELDALEEQLEQLQFAQSAARDAETALRLDAQIENDIVALRAALSSEGYASLEAGVSALKTTVLKREYAYSGAADLGDRIAGLYERIASLSASAGGGSKTVRAPFAGTYSAVSDGYERVLTPEALKTMTPSELAAVAPESVYSTVGKLIRGDKWCYAAAVDEADAAELSAGRRLTLAAAGVDIDLPVTVRSVGRVENGKRLVVVESDEYLSYVTMLRAQSAELILETYTGLRVPKNALRVGEDGQTGVYCRIGRLAYFKPVEIVYRGEDFCLVRPGRIEAATDSQVMLYTLRANDEVIVSAENLFNGKVVG